MSVLTVVERTPVTYEEPGDGRPEGPCECNVRICGEDTVCPDCIGLDFYGGCPVQGMACGWMGGGCEDGCCAPEQVAVVERIYQQNRAETQKRWPGHDRGLKVVHGFGSA